MTLLRKLLCGMQNLIFFSVAIFVLSNAVLELIFAPMLSFKYYTPSLFRATDTGLAFFYVVCILVQVCNFLASLFLFTSILLTGYNEKWLAYDTISLTSVALSLSLLTHQAIVGVDYYRTNVEKDIYMQSAAIGDTYCNRKACFNTDVFNWHQSSQCCGWHSTDDLRGLLDQTQMQRLPQFCCFQNVSQAQNLTCTSDAVYRFREPCSKNRTSFLMMRSVTYISHPSSWLNSILKLMAALAYTFMKKHCFVPQSEGIYSYYVPT